MPEPDRTTELETSAQQLDERLTPRWRSWRWIAAAVAVVLAVALALAIWAARGRGDAVRYTTQAATRGDLIVRVSATGTLQPTNQVEIGTEISGTVERVNVDYNDTVKVGQILARLDTSRLNAQVQQSQAALQSAQAKVLQAQASASEASAQMARLNGMRERTGGTIPSDSELDAAKATLARAEAEAASAKALVAQSRATLEAQRTDLRKAVIRSPINGLVLKRSVEPGQTVAATFQAPVLFVLAENLAQMELQVDVDEADVSALRAGQRATFTVDAYPDRDFAARVMQVRYGAQTVSGVVTYQTVLSVDNSGLELRPGMTATAAIVVDEVTDALLVPNAALRFTPAVTDTSEPASGGGLVSRLLPRPPHRVQTRHEAPTAARQVWTLRNGQPVSIAVHTGATDGSRTQVAEGDLNTGTPLIVDSTAAGS